MFNVCRGVARLPRLALAILALSFESASCTSAHPIGGIGTDAADARGADASADEPAAGDGGFDQVSADAGRENDAAEVGVDVDANGVDANPDCAKVAPLTLSDPQVVAGAIAPGQTASIQLALTDTGGAGYFMYPAATLSTSTSGVTIVAPKAVIAAVDPNQSSFLKWSLTFSASIASGASVSLVAKVLGQAGNLDCANANVFSFTLPIE